MKFIVYKVTFPNNKCYIGITSKSLMDRKKRHYKEVNNNSRFKFHNALRKYFNIEIWEEFCYADSWKNACSLEIKLIKEFNSCHKGYNSTSGGEGNFNPCMKTRKLMSIWQKGKKLTKKHKLNLSLAKLGKKYGKRNPIYKTSKKFFLINKFTKKIIKSYTNISECSRDLNTYPACVNRCLLHPNKYKSYKKFIFRYVGE